MEWFDYAMMRFIWWLLVVVLLVGFTIMDGHDMGIGSLLPFLGKDDEERRVIINTVSAHWEGNQVWFVTGGGAIFAAFPAVYATAFSGFYWAMMAVLWTLIIRPVAFKYRSLVKQPKWRSAWDWGLFVGSFVPALLFGVAVGNLFLGVPFHFDSELRSFYDGSFWGLLNPFSLLCGVISAAMIVTHGAVYLQYRTVSSIYMRCKPVITYGTIVTLVLFTLAGVWILFGIKGYVIDSAIDMNAASNPLNKTVITKSGAWMQNYYQYPVLFIVPALAYLGFIGAWLLSKADKPLLGFVCSSLGVTGIIATAGVAMFPFLMPSSNYPGHSLTVWDSTASHHSLIIMFTVAVIFVPIVLTYTGWAFRVMRGKVTKDYIRENEHSAY